MRNVREGGVLPGVAGGINTPWAGRGKLAAAKRGSVIAGSIIGEIMDTQVADTVRQDIAGTVVVRPQNRGPEPVRFK